MDKLKEKSATLKIVLFFVLLISIFIIPAVINNIEERNLSKFPKYQEIEITEDDLNDNASYTNIRNQLENDYYFAKLSTMMEFSSDTYKSTILRELLWYYIFNYEVTNSKYFFYSENDRNLHCVSKKNLVNGFKELYDIDISNDLWLLPGYYQYTFKKGEGYCLYFDNVAKEYNNDIKVAVERMAMSGTTVTTDVYVYEYHTVGTEEENKYVSYLDGYIKNKDYETCSKIVNSKLNGKVTHKQLKLKVNSKGKFFKYKILSSKKLDY